MALKINIIVVVIFLTHNPTLPANTPNPFFSGQKPPANEQSRSEAVDENDSLLQNPVTNQLFLKLIHFQREFNQKISTVISNYREQKSSELLFYILAIAVSYGFFHAMMPGHGKNILLGWILSSQKRFKKVLFTSSLAMILHVFSAIVMVYAIWLLIGGRISTQTTQLTRYFSFIACGILLYLAGSQLLGIFRRKKSGQIHSHSHEHRLEAIQDQTTWKECIMTAFGVGLVPCPVSSILIVFMISHGFHFEGLLTGLFFGIGMVGTMLIFSSVAWYMPSLLLKSRNMAFVRLVEFGLPIFGSSLMILAAFILIAPHL